VYLSVLDEKGDVEVLDEYVSSGQDALYVSPEDTYSSNISTSPFSSRTSGTYSVSPYVPDAG
jgi:hypothetical protein